MKLKAILLGAGMRGSYAYGNYALKHPDQIQFVAVAEPIDERRERFAKQHAIPDHLCFRTWEDVFKTGDTSKAGENSKKPIEADCILICTQDQMHIEPALRALEAGYHVLMEKPISPLPKECIQITQAAEKINKVFMICHVLRYTPFYQELKRILDAKIISKPVLYFQQEDVGYWHYAHSFVRGEWSNKEKSSPMILSKCCHDMDILLYLAGKHCIQLNSSGSLTYFKSEEAPEGSTARCLEGCSVVDSCPYSAKALYLENKYPARGWLPQAICENPQDKACVEAALAKTDYGKCVFRSNNNVVDHQVVSMTLEDGATAVLVLNAFSKDCTRTIKITGTDGEINGNIEDNKITVKIFSTGEEREITPVKASDSGHNGGDGGLMEDFIRTVNGTGTNSSSIQNSLESHLVCFAAEQARLENQAVRMDSFIEENK